MAVQADDLVEQLARKPFITLMTMTSAATPSITATRLIEATRKMNASPLPGSRYRRAIIRS